MESLLVKKINEAVARHFVLYGTPPLKAVVPESDYESEFPADDYEVFTHGHAVRTDTYLRISIGGEDHNLLIQPGKVTEVTLFRKTKE